MKKILRVLSVLGLVLAGLGCSPDITDDTKFKLYFYNVILESGEDYISKPSYIGQTPHSFEIYGVTLDGKIYYNPILDGELNEKSHSYVNPESGAFYVNQTANMKLGTYSVSIKCVADGVEYSYPDMFVVKLIEPKAE